MSNLPCFLNVLLSRIETANQYIQDSALIIGRITFPVFLKDDLHQRCRFQYPALFLQSANANRDRYDTVGIKAKRFVERIFSAFHVHISQMQGVN